MDKQNEVANQEATINHLERALSKLGGDNPVLKCEEAIALRRYIHKLATENRAMDDVNSKLKAQLRSAEDLLREAKQSAIRPDSHVANLQQQIEHYVNTICPIKSSEDSNSIAFMSQSTIKPEPHPAHDERKVTGVGHIGILQAKPASTELLRNCAMFAKDWNVKVVAIIDGVRFEIGGV